MTITSNTNITEELLYAAQKIVSFYGDSLQSEMCLVQVPISALLEAQEYIDRAHCKCFTSSIDISDGFLTLSSWLKA